MSTYCEGGESDLVAKQTIEVDRPPRNAPDRDRSGLLVTDDAIRRDDRHTRRLVANQRTSVA